MIVLGIDPGTAALGWGIIEQTAGRLRAVDHGCLVDVAGPAAGGAAPGDPPSLARADRAATIRT